jgi:hypothetical protein
MNADASMESIAEARAAHAGIDRLLRERRGRGLELAHLLEVRHLSRIHSFRMPQSAPQALALEDAAAELHATGAAASPLHVERLERRLGKLLGEMEALLAPRVLAQP